MDAATYIRERVFQKLSTLTHLSVALPVFDEVVNPDVPIPSLSGADEVYVVLQDQQETPSDVQPYCYPRFNLNLTIRVVTKWSNAASKKLPEAIGDTIFNLLTDKRGVSKIEGIKQVELVTARSLREDTETNIYFTKVLILNFIKNG